MRVAEVRVGVSMTIPLEQYSNIKPSCELTATLDPGEDPDEIHDILYEKAKCLCMRQAFDLGDDMELIRADFSGFLRNFFDPKDLKGR